MSFESFYNYRVTMKGRVGSRSQKLPHCEYSDRQNVFVRQTYVVLRMQGHPHSRVIKKTLSTGPTACCLAYGTDL